MISLLSLILCFTISSSAIRIPFSQSKRSVAGRSNTGTTFAVTRPSSVLSGSNILAASSNGEDGIDLSTVHDLIYIANVTVGGTDYPVQLDTGSSDFWIQGPTTPLPNTNETSMTFNLTYGIGWAFGHVSQASVEFANISIPSQALLDVSSASNPALSYGASGILGLGFTSLSTIDDLVNQTGASTGRSLLYNAFLDNPKEPNFITFALQRSSDPNDTVVGSFSIGEFDPNYTAVENSTAIPTFPVVAPNRWNVLLDSFIVGSQSIAVSSNVTNAPAGKAVVLLDSGTSYTYCTVEAANAIYGGITGANYSSDLGQWIVPCDAEIDLALQFAGNLYPIHPLDVVPTSLGDPTTCVGSFVPQSVSVGGGEFDWLIGDNVLRSVYSMYDFGDFDSSGAMGNPYVKLLSLINPDDASAEFHSIRGGSALTNITYNASNSTSSSTSSSGLTTISLSDSLANSVNKIATYIPVMLAIIALNALVLLILAVVGICFLVRRRGGESGRRKGRKDKNGSSVALNLTPSAMRAPSPHVYEPVSGGAAEPEDQPFEPPAPAFHAYSGESLRVQTGPGVGARPHSMFTTASGPPPIPRAYRVSAAGSEDTAFNPPSPAFYAEGGMERPKSVA